MPGNVNSGRRPAPLEGTYAPPRRPKRLDKAASYYWDTVVTELIDDRIVEIEDEPALVEMCKCYSRHEQAAALCDEDPSNLRAAGLCAMWWGRLERLSKRFGVNAAARRKLTAKGEDRRQMIAARVRA